MKTKVIANYLPQFHQIPENDLWWGEGYTDWNAVKDAKPLFSGHDQPRVPLSGEYYQLDDINTIKWQAETAKKYGIDGFGIYHYWFSSDLHLLDKPVKIILNNPEVDIDYFFIWDNGSWKRSWDNIKFSNDWAPLYENNNHQTRGILAELVYGEADEWEKHFDYLLPFFKDKRYIKVKNKPVFAFYNQNNEPDVIAEMIKCWDRLAKENGFDGLFDLGKTNNEHICITSEQMLYNPEWNGWLWHSMAGRIKEKIHRELSIKMKHPIYYNYDRIWSRILKDAGKQKNGLCLSGFVAYDDTPRRGVKGRVVKGSTPEKFEKYFSELLRISNKHNNEFVFVTAWNEWGEGAYLEPDTQAGYAYLEALKRAADSCLE